MKVLFYTNDGKVIDQGEPKYLPREGERICFNFAITVKEIMKNDKVSWYDVKSVTYNYNLKEIQINLV